MNYKKKFLTAFFLILTTFILTHSDISLSLALNGLNLWFNHMIPTLLPFMILSGIMVRMNLTEDFAGIFYPILKPVFHISANGIYCIIMGFLCGFPMGSKVISELYEREKLSKTEATLLLAFCNNIGPIYFLGFALPTMGITGKYLPYLFGMYGLPFLYGLLLRYTIYRRSLSAKQKTISFSASQKHYNKDYQNPKGKSLLCCMDDAIISSLNSITVLGGYMIFFNLLNIIPYVMLSKTTLHTLLPMVNALLEITGGLGKLNSSFPLFSLTILPFGGMSCIAQTVSILRNNDLSIQTYVIHKAVLSTISAFYYVLVL